MYALYAESEDETLCNNHDEEFISIAYRIQKYSVDDNCRNESRADGYSDIIAIQIKKRKLYKLQIKWQIQKLVLNEMYIERLTEKRIDYLKERINDDLKQLLWNIWVYSTYAEI